MLERLGRLCVGLGLLWVVGVIGLWLMVGLESPGELAPYIDQAVSSDVRQTVYALLTFVVTPIGMLMLLRDTFMDEGPLWLKLASPGIFLSVYALLLAAAVPDVGQPILLSVDPVVTRLVPGLALGQKPGDGLSWLARFGGLLLMLAGIPGAVGMFLGLLTGGSKRR